MMLYGFIEEKALLKTKLFLNSFFVPDLGVGEKNHTKNPNQKNA